MAYVPGKTILNNAAPHAGKELVLKLDIKDFFSSIHYDMVSQYVFQEYPKPMKHLLAHLCMYPAEPGSHCPDMYLPQGAPTSPYIANIVMRAFDNYIGEYCKRHGITYTRYADDLTFSGAFCPEKVIEKVNSRLAGTRFALNEAKTQILYKGHRQAITGVVVNAKAQAPAEYRRKIRQEMYYCSKFGIREHIIRTNQHRFIRKDDKSGDGLRVAKRSFLDCLAGRIGYVLSINPHDSEMLQYRDEVKRWQGK